MMPTSLEHENYWVRETAYIVNEMIHAIEESKNPELSEKRRKGYAKRSRDLRDKAIMCINNAYNLTELKAKIDSTIEEEKQ